jgi:hypothetical protein
VLVGGVWNCFQLEGDLFDSAISLLLVRFSKPFQKLIL